MRKNIFTKATMRRAAAFGLAGCMAAASLTGCGSSKTESTTAANAETKVEAEGESKAEAADGSDIHVGIIFTEAGLSGNSFNDLALEGVKKAADDYGITYDEVEPKSVSDEEIIQDEMASSGEYDLIICVGAEQVDALTNVATTYPDQKFALLDANSDLDNVASYSCKEQEGAFLAGALAVLAKQEKIDDKLNDGKVIGFIGGVDNPLINHFAAGYQAGAQYIDPDMQVLIDYAGSFNDPTTAKTIARLLPKTQLTWALFLLLATAVLMYIFLWKTSVGYQLRAVGANASAAKTAGIPVNFYLIMAMTLSGGIAALAGVTEIFGKYHRFIEGFSPSFGFTGIAVAILGKNHPAGVLLTSLLFGVLEMGSLRMSRETAVSTNMVTVIQSLVILFVAAPELIRWSRKRRG